MEDARSRSFEETRIMQDAARFTEAQKIESLNAKLAALNKEQSMKEQVDSSMAMMKRVAEVDMKMPIQPVLRTPQMIPITTSIPKNRAERRAAERKIKGQGPALRSIHPFRRTRWQ